MKNIYFSDQKMWQSKWIFTLFLALFFMCGFMLTGLGQTVTIMYDNPVSRPCIASTGSNAPGTYTFIAPLPPCATNISGQAYGGGGGAGGTSSLGGHGGGGGGGGYISLNFSTGTGNSITGQVGGGGARGEGGSNSGRTGGQSYITYNNITIRANGGIGGTYRGPFGGTDGSATGAGGSTSGNGNINIAGTNGGSAGSGTGGGGGNAGGPNGGIGGSVLSSTGVGNNGCNPGGGGSSGYGLSEPGGHGAGGRVLISYDIPTALVSGTGTYCIGNTVNMSICAQTPGITYQWYKDGSLLTGVTGNTYTITNVQVADAGEYWVIATYNINYPNATNVSSNVPGLSVSGTTLLGSLRSASAYITVRPVFVSGEIESGSSTICSGATDPANIGSLSNATGGDGNITYQWYRNGTLVSGSNNATYTIPQSDRINTGATDATIVYTRSANDGTCQTTPVLSSGSYTLTVQSMATTTLQRTQTASVCAHDVSYSLPNWNGSSYVINGNGVWRINGEAGVDYQGTFTGNVYTLANVEEVVTFTFLIYNTAASCQKDNPVDSVVFTLNVSESIYPAFSSDTDTVCSGTTETYVLNVMDIEYEYIWNITGDAGWEVISGGNGDGSLNNYSITILWSNPGNATISVAVTDPENPGCVEGNAEIIVTVKPLPNVSITGTTPICTGETTDIILTSGLAGTTFSWTQTGANVSGATNGSASVIEQELTLTDPTTSGSVIYRVTPTLDGCDGQYEDITIIVNPEATFDVSSITDEDEICVTRTTYGLPDWETEYVINGRGEWSITGGTAVGGSLSGRDYTINSVAGNVVFTFSVFNTETPCQTETAIATKVFTLVIDSSPVAGNIVEADSIVCYNTGITLTLNGYKGNIQWQSSVVSNSEGFTDISGETNETLSTGNLVQDTWFRAVVTNGVCSEVFSDSVLIAVYPEFNQGEIITGNETICIGENASEITSITAASGGDGIYSYQWYDDYGPIEGATALTYTPGEVYTTIAGTYTFYREAMDSTCNTTGVFSTGEWILTVEAMTVPGRISSTQTICSGTAPAPLTLGGTIVGNVVEWQYSTNNFATFTTIANTTTTLTSAEMGNLTANRYYRVMVQNGVCPPAYSDTVLITVNPVTVPGTISPAQTICSGTAPAPLTLGGTIVGNVIEWQYSTNNFATFTTIANTTTTLTSAEMGNLTANRYYRVVVQSGVCPPAYSDTVLITVNPVTVPGRISSAQTICSGTAPAPLTLGGTIVGNVVEWQYSTNNFATFTTIANTTTTLTSAEMGNLTANRYYRVMVQNGVCPPAYSDTVLITVNPITVPGTISPAQTICSGTAPAPLTLGSTIVGNVVEWQYSTNNFATFTTIANTTTTLTSAEMGNLTANRYYRVMVQNGVCPPAYSDTVLITVNPITVPGTISSAQTICSGTAPAPLTLGGTIVGNVVEWQYSTNNFATFTTIANTTTTLTSAEMGNLTANRYYRAVVQNGVCPPAYSDTVLITVNPVTVPGTISPAQTICSGTAPAPLTLGGTIVGNVVEWQYSTNNFATFTTIANTTTTLTSAEMGNLTANRYYRVVVQSGVCPPAYSDTVLITVNPITVPGRISSAQTICSGTAPAPLTLGGTIVGNVVEWQYSTNNFATFTTIANTTTTLTSAEMGNLTANRYYRVMVQNGVCPPAYSDTVLITVQPTAEINLPLGEPTAVFVCAHDTQYELPNWEQYIDYGTGVWTINGTAGVDYQGAFDGIDTYTLAGEETVTFTFSIYNTSAVCQKTTPVETISFTLTVSKSIYPEFNPNTDEVCSGDTKTYTLANVNDKDYEYIWSITGDATYTILSGGNEAGATNNYSIEILWGDAGSATISVTITDPNDLECVSSDATITIIVNSLPTVSITGATTICVTSTTQLSPTTGGTWASSDDVIATVTSTGLVTGVSAGSATFTFTDGTTNCSNTTLLVVVEATTVSGTISEAQTICSGGMPIPLTLGGIVGNVEEWQYSTDNFATFTTIANTTTTLTSTEIGALTTSTYYRAVVKNGVCPSIYSDTVLITVVPQPTLSTPIASNTSICEGGQTTLSSTLSNGTGTPFYQWQYNSGTWTDIVDGIPTGAIYSVANSGNTSTLDILGITAQDNHQYRLLATITGTGCNTATSDPITIAVIAIAVEGYITANDEFVCYNTGTILTLNDYEGSIQWQSSIISATTGFTNIPGEISATLFTGNLTQTTWFRTIVSNSICGAVICEAKEITMILNPTITLTSDIGTNMQTIRVGGMLTDIIYATTDAVGVTVANLPPGINEVWLDDVLTISGTPSDSGTFNYTITLTGICEVATATGTIIVKQACPMQVTDDVNMITYNVIELVGHCWYRENVHGTKYQDNTDIIPEPKKYYSSFFPNENQNAADFGLLYTYETVFPLQTRAGSRTLCPDGWRIPTATEWALLNSEEINKLKNPDFWLQPNSYTNTLNFDMRGAGYYNSSTQQFKDLWGYTAWWSSDSATSDISTSLGAVVRYFCNQLEILEIKKTDAISVRCIMID